MPKAKVTATFSYVPYFTTVAINLIGIAEKAQVGTKFKFCLGSMVFSAFAVEAAANIAGEKIIPNWKHFESTSTLGKVVLISERLGIVPDFSAEPWQTVSAMFKFRNLVVHSKPTKATAEIELTGYAKLMRIPVFPENKLSGQMTVVNAKRFYEAAQEIEMMWHWAAKQANIELTFYDDYTTETKEA